MPERFGMRRLFWISWLDPTGWDRTSLPLSKGNYLQACEGDIRGLKVAWSPDMGYEKVDPRVREICQGR